MRNCWQANLIVKTCEISLTCLKIKIIKKDDWLKKNEIVGVMSLGETWPERYTLRGSFWFYACNSMLNLVASLEYCEKYIIWDTE